MPTNERLYLRTETRRITWPAHAGGDSAFREAAPRPELRSRVAKLRWGYERIPPDAPIEERIVPDGVIHLLFDLARPDGGIHGLVLGATSEPTLVRIAGRIEHLSVELRPGAVPALFGVPARELSGREVGLVELWGARGAELQDRLGAAATPADRIRIIEAALAQVLAGRGCEPPAAVDEALRRIARDGGKLRVRDLAAGIGLTDRRLEQLFHLNVGLSPKTACRLARFRATVDRLAGGHTQSWAELALDRGFSDQSHLANEFRALTGLTPRELEARVGFGFLQD